MRKILPIVITLILCGCSKDLPDRGIESKNIASPSKQETLNTDSKPNVIVGYDGPLGLKKGISPKELTNSFKFEANKDVSNIYFGTPPKEIDGASNYFVLATEKQGICKIIASINIPVVNDTGDQLKDAADKMKDLMEIKYGKKFKKSVYFSQDVYERNPQFFMMALKEESVAYSYIWDSKKIEGGLPNEIESIIIRISATKSSSGDVQVMYEFNNLDDCIKENKEKKASNL